MTDSTKAALRKASQLQALQRRATTPGEAEAAARVLASFLEKHRLSLAQIEVPGEDQAVVDLDDPLLSWERCCHWRRYLATVLAEHYDVVTLLDVTLLPSAPHRKHFEYSIFLCGRPSDIELVRYMYSWLATEIVRLRRTQHEVPRRTRDEWCVGFVSGVREQLLAAREETQEDVAESTKLALRSRLQESLDAVMEMFPRCAVERKNGVTIRNIEAYMAGRNEGTKLHLRKGLDRKKEAN